ncbi:hypothetical protein RHMOL_Rhmol02G0281100 [Rhododendron molle]|uniref:Uncharacterized protein n=1 Tax=Rhododendron molle TaxID=49168 RepID=A0ACC0PWD0_RHOML|nr:hypothetical protein RHMOL_Rhmol02G0281100 [Rhododendron molle]
MHEAPAIAGSGEGLMEAALPVTPVSRDVSASRTCDLHVTMEQFYRCARPTLQDTIYEEEKKQ